METQLLEWMGWKQAAGRREKRAAARRAKEKLQEFQRNLPDSDVSVSFLSKLYTAWERQLHFLYCNSWTSRTADLLFF